MAQPATGLWASTPHLLLGRCTRGLYRLGSSIVERTTERQSRGGVSVLSTTRQISALARHRYQHLQHAVRTPTPTLNNNTSTTGHGVHATSCTASTVSHTHLGGVRDACKDNMEREEEYTPQWQGRCRLPQGQRTSPPRTASTAVLFPATWPRRVAMHPPRLCLETGSRSEQGYQKCARHHVWTQVSAHAHAFARVHELALSTKHHQAPPSTRMQQVTGDGDRGYWGRVNKRETGGGGRNAPVLR
jgi:hypothetical protein